MKARDARKLPNKSDIMSCLTSDDIFNRYLGGIPNTTIASPIREDKTPSFSLFRHDQTGELMYKDFATGDVGDCFVFVKNLLKYNKLTDVFCRVADDFMLTQFSTVSPGKSDFKFLPGIRTPVKTKKSYVTIKVKRRNWTNTDVNYWKKKYGFSRVQLEYCGIYPISHFFIGEVAYIADKRAYVFVEKKDGKQTYKIYQPSSTKRKWVSNNNFSVWELWTQLPSRGRKLIITSSRKDALMIKSMFPSKIITSCSLQNEITRPKIQVINELKSRFRDIYILYDNDYSKPNNPGRTAGKKFSKEFGITQIEIPEIYRNKDISDLANKRGRNIAETLIKRLIRESDGLDGPF